MAVSTTGASAALMAFANNAMDAFNKVKKWTSQLVLRLRKKFNLFNDGDRLEEEEEDEELVNTLDDAIVKVEASKIDSVVTLADASREVKSAHNDSVMPFSS